MEKSAYTVAYVEKGNFWYYKLLYQSFQKELRTRERLVKFPSALHFSLGWDSTNEEMTSLAQKLFQNPEIDLIVVMGTVPNLIFLEQNNHKTPLLGMGIDDALDSGLIASATDTGADNYTCEYTPGRWENMFRVFFEVANFKKLGIMYEEKNQGRMLARRDDALRIGNERGYEVLEEIIPDDSTQSCLRGLAALKERGMDAFFIGPLSCFDFFVNDTTDIMNWFVTQKMPTFARDGAYFVQAGALLGFSTWDLSKIVDFLASAAQAAFRGESLRAFGLAPKLDFSITVNLETARRLDFILPFDILVVADQIFNTVEQPILP